VSHVHPPDARWVAQTVEESSRADLSTGYRPRLQSTPTGLVTFLSPDQWPDADPRLQ